MIQKLRHHPVAIATALLASDLIAAIPAHAQTGGQGRRVADALAVITVTGMVVANRLLPADLAGKSDGEKAANPVARPRGNEPQRQRSGGGPCLTCSG